MITYLCSIKRFEIVFFHLLSCQRHSNDNIIAYTGKCDWGNYSLFLSMIFAETLFFMVQQNSSTLIFQTRALNLYEHNNNIMI